MRDSKDWIIVGRLAVDRPEVRADREVRRKWARGHLLTYAQMAEHLGIPEGTFRTDCHRNESLADLGIRVDKDGLRLEPDRWDEAEEVVWDHRVVDNWYRYEDPRRDRAPADPLRSETEQKGSDPVRSRRGRGR